jgi:hypothetical protein
MRLLSICALFILAGCPKPDPKPDQCPTPDGGTTLQTPCIGSDGQSMQDGAACCLGTKPGTCQSHECVAK